MILLSDEEIERVVSEYMVRLDYSASVGDRAIAKAQAKKILDEIEKKGHSKCIYNREAQEEEVCLCIHIKVWQRLRREIEE